MTFLGCRIIARIMANESKLETRKHSFKFPIFFDDGEDLAIRLDVIDLSCKYEKLGKLLTYITFALGHLWLRKCITPFNSRRDEYIEKERESNFALKGEWLDRDCQDIKDVLPEERNQKDKVTWKDYWILACNHNIPLLYFFPRIKRAACSAQ